MRAKYSHKCTLMLCVLIFTLNASAQSDTIVYRYTFDLSEFNIVQIDSLVDITTSSEAKHKYGYYKGEQPKLPLILIEAHASKEKTHNEKTYTCKIEKNLILSDVYVTPGEIDWVEVSNPMSGESVQESTMPQYEEGIYPDESVILFYNFDQFYHYGQLHRDEKIAFRITPFVYDAVSKDLYFISSVEITFNSEVPQEEKLTYSTNNTRVDYLIVTADSLKEAFASLKSWKTKKGIKTDIISLNDINENYATFEDMQERIKRCIYDYHKNRGTTWVLLGGDESTIPVRNCIIKLSNISESSVAADLYYSTFDKCFDWDLNNNNVYGELEDSIDYEPNLNLSRLPIRTAKQANAYIDKLIRYERAFKKDGWHTKLLLLANIIDTCGVDGRSDAHIQIEKLYTNHIKPIGDHLSKYYMYDDESNLGDFYPCTTQNVVDAINNVRPHFLQVYTHGKVISWKTFGGPNDRLSNTELEYISNDSKPMIISTMSCLSNKFDNGDTPSFSETFIRKEGGGALAYWGSSDSSWETANLDTIMYVSMYAAHFWESILGIGNNSFAYATSEAKKKCAKHIKGYKDPYLWLQLSMNAIGDAEVPIYTRTPSIIDDAEIHVYPVSVSVTTDSTAYIAITSTSDNGNSIYQTANATSYSYNNGSTPVSVCLTRKNHVPLLIEGGGIYESMGYACLHLQNAKFPSSSTTYHSENAYIGSRNGGNVIVENSGKLVIDSDIKTVVYGGLHCKKGGKLVIK